jgi:hypothetical protein
LEYFSVGIKSIELISTEITSLANATLLFFRSNQEELLAAVLLTILRFIQPSSHYSSPYYKRVVILKPREHFPQIYFEAVSSPVDNPLE